jgi:hypothetical protein
VIPVEVTQTPWHYTTVPDALDHWQTVIAGVLALAAAWLTIRATKRSADREIEASQAQTAVAQKQIETTVRLEQERVANEALAFRAMLEAAMKRVLDEADWARKNDPYTFESTAPWSPEAFAVRQRITKGGFAELRAACVRQGGPLTGEFLDLEREIDSFAGQWKEVPSRAEKSFTVREGKHEGLGDQLTVIEDMARELLRKAARSGGDLVVAPRKQHTGGAI